MDRAKTSEKPKKSSRKLKLKKFDTSRGLKDPLGVLETLLQCLAENDLESFEDVLVAHLRVVNKSKLAAETEIGRQTIYDLMNPEKPFNPTIQTIGPILKVLHGQGERQYRAKNEMIVSFVQAAKENRGRDWTVVSRILVPKGAPSRSGAKLRDKQGSPSGKRARVSGKHRSS